jgi:hypothetical protein
MKNIYLSMVTMAAKMNSETHKVIVARYQGPEILYAVPKDWDPEKVRIRYGVFYYDGEEVNPPSFETEPDSKFPIEVEDGSNDFDLDSYFDCEEEPPKCKECDNLASINKYYPNGDYKEKYWNLCEECFKKDQEEEERYCDNEKCPYEGYCFGEVKEQFEGKPYICEGCSTGIGVQEKEEEVRTCCEKCEGEGMVLVSKERAKELKEQELLEGLCPFGDKCAGEESDSDAEDYFEKRDEVEDAMLKRFIVPQWYKKKHIVKKCKEQGLSDSDVEEVIDFLKTEGHKDVDQMLDELIEERKK